MKVGAIVIGIIFLYQITYQTANPIYPNHFRSGKLFQDVRDGNSYQYIQIDNLYWFAENLRFQTNSSSTWTSEESDMDKCGIFYGVQDAFSVCPDGWRLPTEKEVEFLIKADKKKRINIIDTLQLKLCGRIDNGQLSKIELQNTFWIDTKLIDGNITHWHTFGSKHELHNHNVTNAKRKFPVRCVCEISTQNN
ncbi:MAG: hypothetical protein KDC34_18805 [Saprospiraceae bacterium]|nr:hypothetical protein [Saprospiraceae bacterium]